MVRSTSVEVYIYCIYTHRNRTYKSFQLENEVAREQNVADVSLSVFSNPTFKAFGWFTLSVCIVIYIPCKLNKLG